MNNKKLSLKRAVHACIFTAGMIATTQLHALSMLEPDQEMASPLSMMDEVFLTADADGNQQLSLTEFYQLHAAKALLEYEMTFKQIDTDGSGDVESEEFTRFLSVQMNANIKDQFLTAAGENGLLDMKAFLQMRINAQNDDDSLLWKFATMDQDKDGELTPMEFYGIPFMEPPAILPEPEVTVDAFEPTMLPTKPQPEITIDALEPTMLPVKPQPEITVEAFEPEMLPNQSEQETPAEEVEETENTVDQTSPAEATPELLEKTAELNQQLAVLEKRMARVTKSIDRTKEKMEMANNDRKASRLERRLKRQTERLNNVTEKYEATMMQLQEAQQMLEG